MEGEVLFVRSTKSKPEDGRTSEASSSVVDDEIWDDTALVKAYDDAVGAAKEEIARAMGLSKDAVSGNESSSLTKKNIANVSKLGKKTSGYESGASDKIRRRTERQSSGEWWAGDHCRVVYSGDGAMYEAEVIKMIYDKGTCVVEYVGYGNEEEVPVKALQLSQGKQARKKQIKAAAQDDSELPHTDGVEMECSEGESAKNSQSKPKFESVPRSPHGNKMDWESQTVHPPGHGLLPPHFGPLPMGVPPMVVPPPPPPHLTSNFPEEDAEALSAMLMSWYMSGFHTGYYQGLKQAKHSPVLNGGYSSRNSWRKK